MHISKQWRNVSQKATSVEKNSSILGNARDSSKQQLKRNYCILCGCHFHAHSCFNLKLMRHQAQSVQRKTLDQTSSRNLSNNLYWPRANSQSRAVTASLETQTCMQKTCVRWDFLSVACDAVAALSRYTMGNSVIMGLMVESAFSMSNAFGRIIHTWEST